MYLGLDFGTSNTSAAIYDGKQVRHIPLDPFNKEDVNILSSMLYITSTGQRFYGQKAINEYIEQMLGFLIQFEREEFGEIEMTFGDMTYVAQSHYLVEKNVPGRLFQYLKKYLNADFQTNVFGTYYKPYQLITLLLKHIKIVAEEYLAQELDGVILGRPVKFSEDEQTDRDFASNLELACHRAGFAQVEFQYEPVAAAFNYALTARQAENILIFDFGGGTFDVTVVRVEHGASDVLGLGGVPVGGSDFDRAIMHEKITPLFGRGMEVDGLPVSNGPYIELLNWQSIMQLNRDRHFLKILDDWIYYADDPRPFTSLRRLIKENHGFAIFREIERAKKALSAAPQATVTYKVPEVFEEEGEILIDQPITRQEFQELLINFSEKVFRAIDAALKDANLSYNQIDRVIRVGGSSKIPFFYQKLLQTFGEEKLLMRDEFKNVSAGLAVAAFEK
ncbi:molecular chaperone-like protein [Candidatus Vecturithrix granuli]|uniref:Molecular chaperone-like protein n=1 Tax=Vecturithrix granuli TaxID=1499967 RepID=A0A081BUY9_VECG1|nr:molecular chaperone-like protein [Candidatus Vecturithrix granuli]